VVFGSARFLPSPNGPSPARYAVQGAESAGSQDVAPSGTLVTCSCSHYVSWDEFHGVVAAAAGDAQRRIRLLERRGAAPDHPVVLTIPETEYSKCLILQVD